MDKLYVESKNELPLFETPAAATDDKVLVVATGGGVESRLPLICFPEPNQAIGVAKIQLGEHVSPLKTFS